MFNANTLKTELINLVGWRQNDDPNGVQINDLTTSDSGLYFNDVHPTLTINNIDAVTPDYLLFYDDFNEVKDDYKVGDKVKDGSSYYERIGLPDEVQPLTNVLAWNEFSPFTTWLKNKTEAGIISTINYWYNNKFKKGTSRNLLFNDRIYPEGGDFQDTQTKENKIVGESIIPRNNRGIIAKVEQISVQFTDDQDITIKLFKKGVKTPVKTKTVSYTGSGSIQWFDISDAEDWTLEGGSHYFICYDESAITGNAINAIRRQGLPLQSKYHSSSAFKVDSVFTEMFNEEDVIYTSDSNFGLNYKLTISCDYTDFIVEQKSLFAMAIYKGVGMLIMRELIYNPNGQVNKLEKNIDDNQMLYEINGNSEGDPQNNNSISKQFYDSINSINFDISGIDKVCLKRRRVGVKYTAVR